MNPFFPAIAPSARCPLAVIFAFAISPGHFFAQKTCDSLYLQDGRTLAVEIEKTTASEIRYARCGDNSGTKYQVPTTAVRQIRFRDGRKQVFDAAEAPKDSTQLFHLETTDGNDYIGHILRQDSETVTFRTENLGTIVIRRTNIKSIEPVRGEQMVKGQFWFENPQATRYFFGPTGYGLRAGEGYYQNTWVLYNQVSYGFTNNFSVGVGTVPVFLFGASVFPLWVTPKVSIPIKKDKLNAGAGLFYFNALELEGGENYSLGVLYGNLTFGSRDKNATFSLGYGFADGGWADKPTFSFSAMSRLARKHYFITENYFIPVGEGTAFWILSAGMRTVGKRLAIDYGLFRPFSGDGEFDGWIIAFPWLGITVPFGKKAN